MNILTLAQAAPADGGAAQPTGIEALLGSPAILFVLLAVVVYFLLLRPQQKQRKEHLRMVSELKTGDRVVLSGGIHGVVANVKDKTLLVKIAENTKIEVERASVSAVLPAE
ncbi:MAG: preprotein translocase subunit YajC [Verrucomicrobiales bacterium]|nr:preprotein translocase subunit YajC [Verrucomicrobiales bacterium]